MKTPLYIAGAFLATLLMAGAASSTGQGDVVIYGGAGQGKVIFDGRVHAAKGFVCNDCHSALFETRKKALIDMNDHGGDKACFACHNGAKAFNDCGSCHRKL